MLLYTQPEVEWDDTEVEWMRSLEHVRQTDTCSLCGMPKKICRNSKNERKFRADAERCFATAAMHRQQEKDQSGSSKMPDPGSLVYSARLET